MPCYHLSMRKISITAIALIALVVAACSPTYNWRDYSSPDAPYRVMFPAKPATYTRPVELDGMKVNMTMTAAEVEDTMFAVGSAEATDPQHAQAALAAMKTALVHNIGGTITKETATAAASSPSVTGSNASLNIEATGTHNGTPMHLIGHFEARDKRIYQVIVMGKAKSVSPEQVEQFFTSFKPQ
jgi:hypothetical protein